jgi:hypothetical protein
MPLDGLMRTQSCIPLSLLSTLSINSSIKGRARRLESDRASTQLFVRASSETNLSGRAVRSTHACLSVVGELGGHSPGAS